MPPSAHRFDRPLPWFGLLGIMVFVLAHAVYVAWPWSVRPFWQDECKHNVAILAAVSLPAMIVDIGFMGQPALDHVLRRLVWFPLFGHQEFGLRLPSLVYYVAMLCSGIGIAAWFLARRRHSVGYVLFGALLVGLWMTTKPMEPWNAFEARHYSLVSLCSLWWCTLAIVAERPSPRLWWPVTLLFANVHFFALPLIAAVSLLDAREALRAGQRRAAVLVLACAAGVALVTIVANLPAWRSLTQSPPGARMDWLAGLAAGGRTCWEFVRYIFKAGVPVVLVWAGLLGATGRRDNRRLLACGLVFVPLLLVALRLRSDYPFSGRYFTPFFGIAFVTLLLALDQGPGWLDGWSRRGGLSAGRTHAARWAGLAGLFLLFQVGAAGLHLTRLGTRLAPVAQNGSPTFHLYEAVKRADRPVLVISELCFNDATPRLYLRYIGSPFRHAVHTLRARACGVAEAEITGGIGRFLAETPGGLVLLDQTDTGEPDCGERPVTGLAAGLSVRQAPDGQCAWLAQGVRTPADLRRVARAVGFRSLDWWSRP